MAKRFKKIGFNPSTRKMIYYQYDDNLPFNLTYAYSRYFGLFLAVDTPELEDDAIYSYAYNVVNEGMVYCHLWGRNCKKIHDIFDEVIQVIQAKDEVNTNQQTTILNKTHENESIDESLVCYLNYASPSEYYMDECTAELILCIGNKRLDTKIRALLKKQINAKKKDTQS
ncbi:hypothetical protein JW835_02325 [bacterium]|nr:hypothetical protein [bacterium]